MKSIRLISYIFVVAAVLSLAGCRSSRKVVRGNESASTTVGGLDRSRPDTRKMQGDDKKLVDEALTWLGTPYRYGGSDYNGTDCSGLTMEVYRKALGIKIPRSSREQQQFCKSISKGALMIGDLVFFSTGRDKNRVSHVGMYVGDGKIVHASGSKGVIISNMSERYYTSTYHSSGHVGRSSDKHRNKNKKNEIPQQQVSPSVEPDNNQSAPAPQRLETDPLRFNLNQEVEARIDSIYSSFLD
ncbi:C40 family peptidase [Muribaculum sp.]|uniref:C40 family peptidase n=1 Tax=Muribaculum sp. TaxID=1918611 RepID=UPI0023D19A5F|nr:C40 family peptidase [Muribaculum sp.]MDE5704808.1 C40 family peptidase [Muribaculum sp.]